MEIGKTELAESYCFLQNSLINYQWGDLLQGEPQVTARRPGRERRVVFSVCEDSGHGSSEGEGRVSEVEEEEEYSYVYSSRVCPAQLIRQQGDEEGEEENIYEEIGQHFAPASASPVGEQSSPIVRSRLQLYRSRLMDDH